MIRDELTGSAKHVSALLLPTKGLLFQRRIANGATTTQTFMGMQKPPYWVKVTRAGQLFTAFASSDGKTWTNIGSETVNLNRLAYVGLAVTSRSGKTLTTARFSNVTVRYSLSWIGYHNYPSRRSVASPPPSSPGPARPFRDLANPRRHLHENLPARSTRHGRVNGPQPGNRYLVPVPCLSKKIDDRDPSVSMNSQILSSVQSTAERASLMRLRFGLEHERSSSDRQGRVSSTSVTVLLDRMASAIRCEE